ncbi:MAG: hypothetical protein ABDK93_02085 [Atribacterota bacterium]
MLRLIFEPVPYRHEETVYIYWEYELERPYQLCLVPFRALNMFLEEAVAREGEFPENIRISFEDGRIRVWTPFASYSEYLFERLSQFLRERVRALLEEIIF